MAHRQPITEVQGGAHLAALPRGDATHWPEVGPR
jgi:hypothetical protein